MKKIFSANISLLPIIFVLLAITFNACKKDSDGSPESKAGTPVFGSINPTEASGGKVVTITGSGLGDIRSIVFDNKNVPAVFSPNLNTDAAIIFRVPDTAFGGNQNIILTNSAGKTLSVPFKVIALPILSTIWPTDFQQGSTVTITGNNLDDVTTVTIDGTEETATIVSKDRKKLVITMPASSVDNGKIKVTNASGSSVSAISLVNIDKAVAVFTDDFMNGFQSWSWGGTFEPSTDFFITGTKSCKAAYDPSGTWGGLQMGNGGSIDVSACRYFSFWVKGADVDKKIQFWINWGNQHSDIVIPANVWTYFKYDMVTDFAGVTSVNNVTFQIYEEGHTMYFDNVVFTK